LGTLDLTEIQKVSIDHYADFKTLIPRDEVEALARCVNRIAKAIDPFVELIVGGSHRRGAAGSRDFDFIVRKKGTTFCEDLSPILRALVEQLEGEVFLTFCLARHRKWGNKWQGACLLPKDDFPWNVEDYRPIWRRIDFLLVPESELGGGLIYFTGNDLFVRSMRELASEVYGMQLNHRELYADVPKGADGTKTGEGTLVEGRDEKKIFQILEVPWREPWGRWC
jgi:DNA polymerase IV